MGTLLVVVALAGACSTKTVRVVAPVGTHPAAAVSSTTTEATSTTSSTSTSSPTTSTTSIPTAVVPDAAAAGQECGCKAGAVQTLTQAGFKYQMVPTSSGACYITGPDGQQEWNAAAVVGQDPNPGTVEPVGSVVDLLVCGGEVSIP